MNQASVPAPVRKRLVTMLLLLEQCGTARITSAEIGRISGRKDSLVRHDLFCAGISGGASNGYAVGRLADDIRRALGMVPAEPARRCCIVGLGRLGAALLDDDLFAGSGFQIAAGFDSNVNRTEILRSSFPLYPASKIETVVPAERIEYALLAVPEKEAPVMAERLARCPVRGIVNFTSAVLDVPPEIRVEGASPVAALLRLASAGW
ncbi:MAG: CoA-binding protein [Treponemataceae bacterium]|nr:CoA-binding protein [Treponemataceae bacterium]